MGLHNRLVVAAAAALLLGASVTTALAGDAVDTPAPPVAPTAPSWEAMGVNSNVVTPSLETAADLDRFLARTNLRGMGAVFLRAEAQSGVSARFLIAITWVENNSGASYLAQTQHNLFSFVGGGPGGFQSFPTFEDSILTSAEFIGREYARPGGHFYRGGTIAAIGHIYAEDPNWPVKVATAANYIGPSTGVPYAASVHLAALAADHVVLHLANDGYAPIGAGQTLLVHYRWVRRGESIPGVRSLAAPGLGGGAAADLEVGGLPAAPASGAWRLDITVELTAGGWVADLGPDASDSLRFNSGGGAELDVEPARLRTPAS
ncbi:MAG: hypothetical protein NVS9B1_06520 [Candidatus Dormibacteraceae bacterium]